MFIFKNIRRLSSYPSKYVKYSRNYSHNLRISRVHNQINSNNNTFRTFNTYRTSNQLSNEIVKISKAFSNLDNNYRQQSRVKKSDIEQLISCIENEDIINDDKYILLLQCCGQLIPDESQATKTDLVKKVWQALLTKKINLSTDHYNALLRCYIDNKMSLNHKDFLAGMNCEPNVQTYDLILECVCESGDLNQAIEIVNLMKEKGFFASEAMFGSLIFCHLRNGDMKTAQNILSTMRIAHINPSAKTYTALLRGYAENNEKYLFQNTLSDAQNCGFNLNQLISILHSACVSENLDLLPLIKKVWLSKFDSRLFESKLNNLCVHLIYLGKPRIAYDLFKSLIEPEVGFVGESNSYCSLLIYELIKSNTPSEIIIDIADDLIRNKKNIYALFKATEIALRIPDVQYALAFMQALYDRKNVLRNHYFWPILIHQATLFGEKGIFEIFEKMRKYNIKIEPETLEVYSLQYIKNMDPNILINKLKEFNLTVTEVLSPISVVLLREGKIKEVSDITTKYKVKLDGTRLIKQLATSFVSTNDVDSTINILNNVQAKNNSENWTGQFIFYIFTRSGDNINYKQILELLKAYKQKNMKISVVFIEKIESIIKRISDKEMRTKIQKIFLSLDAINAVDHNNHIPHPRNMNIDELECHLIELRDKNMDTRGILRKLIQMHSRFGNLQRVTDLCTEFEKLGYSSSPGMKSSILDAYLKSEQFEKALNMYQTIKNDHPTFFIDEFKIVDLANLLCRNNRISEAISLLKNESSERNIIGEKQIEKNCWRLLDTVAKMGKVTEIKILFETLVKNKYCTESNIILGPLIRVHIANNDKAGAVEEYVNCCTKYGKTPLSHELMCYLVKNESSSELIKKVVESSALIHGASQIQTTLAAALAETGLTKTLRKLFLDNNVYLSQNSLEQYCERWIKENKIHALKNLITGAQGIKSVDLNVVYFHLMKAYSSNEDCDNAISLWNEMQDRNIFPNTEIKNLIDSLIRQKSSAANNQTL